MRVFERRRIFVYLLEMIGDVSSWNLRHFPIISVSTVQSWEELLQNKNSWDFTS